MIDALVERLSQFNNYPLDRVEMSYPQLFDQAARARQFRQVITRWIPAPLGGLIVFELIYKLTEPNLTPLGKIETTTVLGLTGGLLAVTMNLLKELHIERMNKIKDLMMEAQQR